MSMVRSSRFSDRSVHRNVFADRWLPVRPSPHRYLCPVIPPTQELRLNALEAYALSRLHSAAPNPSPLRRVSAFARTIPSRALWQAHGRSVSVIACARVMLEVIR